MVLDDDKNPSSYILFDRPRALNAGGTPFSKKGGGILWSAGKGGEEGGSDHIRRSDSDVVVALASSGLERRKGSGSKSLSGYGMSMIELAPPTTEHTEKTWTGYTSRSSLDSAVASLVGVPLWAGHLQRQ